MEVLGGRKQKPLNFDQSTLSFHRYHKCGNEILVRATASISVAVSVSVWVSVPFGIYPLNTLYICSSVFHARKIYPYNWSRTSRKTQKGFRSRLRRAENMVDIKVLLVFAQYPSEKFSAGVYCPQYMYNQFGNFSVWIFSRPGNQKRNWQQRAISLVMGLVCIANIGVRAGWG